MVYILFQITEITVSSCSLPPLLEFIISVDLPVADTGDGLDQLEKFCWLVSCWLGIFVG